MASEPRTKRVVFVCTGNICRSPMAAALARAAFEKLGQPCVVISAGTLNIQGSAAAPHAVQAMAELGLSIADHRSQGVSPHLLRLADQIVVMSPDHERSLVKLDPALEGRIQRLWEYAEPPGRLQEIADPVGLEYEAFEKCRDELARAIERWARRVTTLG